MQFRETAYAKLNLALHVRKRRDDGYHELETLFAFVDGGDELTVETADTDSLHICGEFGQGLSNGVDNLVLQALAVMRQLAADKGALIPPLSITLEKRLPVAAGIGGGSADAGAMIRMLDAHFLHNGNQAELVAATHSLGADVGACIVSETRIGRGLGWELAEPAIDDLQGIAVLLVNPRIPLSTGPVFKAWDGEDRGAMPSGTAREIAFGGRNDLEKPALEICPVIAEVLEQLRQTGASLVRMSGSGATCFALFDTTGQRDAASRAIAAAWPDWWQLAGQLR